jgi:hypothetical protein
MRRRHRGMKGNNNAITIVRMICVNALQRLVVLLVCATLALSACRDAASATPIALTQRNHAQPSVKFSTPEAPIQFQSRSEFGSVTPNASAQRLWSPDERFIVQHLDVPDPDAPTADWPFRLQALSVFNARGQELQRFPPNSHSPEWSPDAQHLLLRIQDPKNGLVSAYVANASDWSLRLIRQDAGLLLPMGWVDHEHVSHGQGSALAIYRVATGERTVQLSVPALGDALGARVIGADGTRLLVWGRAGLEIYDRADGKFRLRSRWSDSLDGRVSVDRRGDAVAFTSNACVCVTIVRIGADGFAGAAVRTEWAVGHRTEFLTWISDGNTLLFNDREVYSIHVDGGALERRTDIEALGPVHSITTDATGHKLFVDTGGETYVLTQLTHRNP